MGKSRLISMSEVAKHNTKEDLWVVIHNKVYDLTPFVDTHPGGIQPILSKAGKDATKAFDVIHPPDIVSQLPSELYIGDVDPSTVVKDEEKDQTAEDATKAVVVADTKPPVDFLLNVFDFEAIAQKVMKKEAWDYYSSGADDEVTLRENHAAFQRVWLRPRVLVDVTKVDMRCKILGYDSSFPLYISATALAKLAHPEGEVVLTRAAYSQGIIQMMPTLASRSLEDMVAARQPGQVQFFQLYVNSSRKITEELIRRAEKGGAKALFITVDAPQLGRREKDMRNKFTANEANVQKEKGTAVDRNQGTARAISSFIDPSLSWKDLAWFKSITTLPIVLKGVQCGEDAILAAKHGVAGIVVSNHGGRQLDYCRSAIEILPEVMDALRSVGAEKKLEVFVDGGVRRGSDIFKALALGAKAVGIGRPTLYGLASYGQEGVEKVVTILRDELDMTMKLMGTPAVSDVKPEMVTIRNLADHFVPAPKDFLSATTYERLTPRSKL
jgi:L-lactate dehydrogenase (cytochrome)